MATTTYYLSQPKSNNFCRGQKKFSRVKDGFAINQLMFTHLTLSRVCLIFSLGNVRVVVSIKVFMGESLRKKERKIERERERERIDRIDRME